MEGVGAAPGNVVDDRALIAAVLRAEVVGQDLKLLEGVLVAEEVLRAGDGVVVVGLAVDLEVVGAAALSVGGEADAIGVGEVVGKRTDDAGNQEGEPIETAAGGEVGNLGGVGCGCSWDASSSSARC